MVPGPRCPWCEELGWVISAHIFLWLDEDKEII